MKAKPNSRENLIVVGLVFVCVILFLVGSFITSGGRTFIISGGVPVSTGIASTSTFSAENVAKPSQTPKPTATVDYFTQLLFEAIQHRPKGMGIRRDQIQPAYEKEGFVFQEDTSLDGQPRSSAVAQYGVAVIELFGPADNLTRTSVTVSLGDSPAELIAYFGYMLKMVQLVAPDWKEGPVWFQSSLTRLNQASQNSYQEETSTYKNIRFRMRVARPLNLMSLTCEGTE